MSKKKKRRKPKFDPNRQDFHHFLFQGRHWQVGYAKLLRQHWYMGKYIPQMTLHREIHSKIHDVPCPNGKECKEAYLKLVELEKQGLISENDTVETRLDFLIECWKDKCPATCAVLKWQKQVVSKFYGRQA